MALQADESNPQSSDQGAAATRKYEFALLNAFTRSLSGGNPAAVVLLNEPFPEEQEYLYRNITASLNQPVVSFVSQATQAEEAQQQPEHSKRDATNTSTTTEYELIGSIPASDTATFRIRYLMPTTEVPLCGHATIATASWLFSRPELVPPDVRLLRFLVRDGMVITARLLLPHAAPPRIQICLPAYTPIPVDDAKFDQVRKIVAKAWRRDVPIKFVGVPKEAGEIPHAGQCMMIELENPEDIHYRDLNKEAFAETGDTICTNIVTAASRNPDVAYESRIFAPNVGILEDHVCGSANCLTAPYWMNKLGVASKSEMVVKQASERGGDLWVAVDTGAKQIELSGEAVLVAEGRIYI